jgi:CheY-like chemotaxis protein
VKENDMTDEPDLEHPTAENAKCPHETWRILFLDNAAAIEQLKGACKECGYVVIGATTIKEAFAFLDGTNHADVIVCAAHLEHESMLKFLKAVRDSHVHRNSKFLILSLEPGMAGARVDRSTERAGMLLGADAYSIMPKFDPEELIAQIQKLQPAVPALQQAAAETEKRRSE